MTSLLDRFVKDVEWTFGDRVLTITLFGSTVTGDWQAGHSDHNLLIVLKQIRQAELALFSSILPPWLKAGQPTPLLMTPEELERGADVFPMEYLDMKDARRVLSGADVVAGLQVSRANLRHECESEWRGKVMKFRDAYAAVADQPEAVRSLVLASWSTFATIGKGLLRLEDRPIPSDKPGVYDALADLVGGSSEIFRAIHRMREDPWAMRPASWADVVHAYLQELDRIVAHVDRLGLKAHA